MKKMALLVGFLVVVVFLMVNLAMAKAVPITAENISQLKGTWGGSRCLSVSNSSFKYFPTELEINNDSVPLEGVLICRMRTGGPEDMPFKNGTVDEKGRLSVEWDSRNWILLTLQSSGALKGECRFTQGAYDLQGTLILKKK
jgi:hypothetical protein